MRLPSHGAGYHALREASSMNAMTSASSPPVPIRLAVSRDGADVPALAWVPASPRATVVVGHGGSGHKASPAVLGIVEALVARRIATVAIDGPVHGERRSDGSLDPARAKEDFRAAWRAGVGHASM